MTKTLRCVLVGLAIGLAGSPAFAGEDPQLAPLLEQGAQALLEETDRRHNAFTDQTIRVKMAIEGGAADGTVIESTTTTKGRNQRAVRMHAPSNLKGMGVVVKSRDEIYVRLPDSRKVRRVGSHAKRQTFMGTTWNFDDMSMIWLAPDFNASLKTETGTHVVLNLTRKDGVDLQYKTVEVHVTRDRLLVERLLYFDNDGKHVKTQVRSNVQMNGDVPTYQHVEMTDETNGTKTITTVISEKLDTGVKDRMFGRRWLSRGP